MPLQTAADLASPADQWRQHSHPASGIKLLVVSSDLFPPSRVDVTVLFGEELASRGHRIDWILQSEKECPAPYVAAWAGGRVWVGPTDIGPSLFHRVRKHFRSIIHDLKLFPLLRNGQYDVVEVKDKFISGIFALLAVRFTRTRFVYWLSYPIAEEYLLRARDGTARYPFLYLLRGYVFKVVLYRILLRLADHIFVQSEQMRRDVAAQGIPLEKMTPVPMGVKINDAAAALQDERRTVLPPSEPCIVYIGTLSKVRRLDFLVRTLFEVRKQVPNARLYLAGRGDAPDDEELLATEARRLNVSDGLVLLGLLPQPEALRYVREADVCVSPLFPNPILNAGTPTKVVEYMAAGKAVVANDHPDQRLLVEGSGGGYCVSYDETQFAEAIVKLLREPQTAKAMGILGRRYVMEHRAYSKIADVVERALLRIASTVKSA